jgi:hypothetical protein
MRSLKRQNADRITITEKGTAAKEGMTQTGAGL